MCNNSSKIQPRSQSQQFYIVLITWKSRLLTTFVLRFKTKCANNTDRIRVFCLNIILSLLIWFFPHSFWLFPSPRYSHFPFSFHNSDEKNNTNYGSHWVHFQFKKYIQIPQCIFPKIKVTPTGITFAFSF